MTEILAVFRSRSQAIDCNTKLKALRIPTALIPTPKQANVGCGLSVKFGSAYLTRVKNFLNRANYSAFGGYLRMETTTGGAVFYR